MLTLLPDGYQTKLPEEGLLLTDTDFKNSTLALK